MNRFRADARYAGRRAGLPRNFTLVQALLALVAGAAHAASLAWPGTGEPVWWLQGLALAGLAGLLERCRRQDQETSSPPNWRLAALWGWLFGTAWLAGAFGWTFVALHTYGGLPAVLAVLAVLALSGLLALLYAAVCGLYMALAPVNHARAAIVFAACWLLAELARGSWLTGFGWGASGYAHVDGPLAGLAPWLGVYGLCFAAAWLAMSLAQLLQAGRERSLRRALWVGAPLLVLLALPIGLQRMAPEMSTSAGRLSVTLLQGNIPQDEKFETGSGVPLALQWYGEQLLASRSALVIAPETAIPVLPQQLPPDYWAGLQQRFATGQQAALIGSPLGNYKDGYTNSVVGLQPGQTKYWRYDKHHLVPFGEFIPPLFKWFTQMMNIPLGDFNRGALVQPPFAWQGQRVATNICYEDLFGEELAPQFLDPAQAPTLFVNISNLAWFGDSMAMDQHLQIARMRALEFARPFVLATNTGVSAIVDHRARVVNALPRNTRAVLEDEVEGRTGITPYAHWVSRLGLWPYWGLALGAVGLALRRRLRKR
jgi:apolipoprotein N-acyltransferase